jgi:chaperonin GroEL
MRGISMREDREARWSPVGVGDAPPGWIAGCGFGDPDERTGAQIIVRALEEPLRQLADNAGLEASVVVNKVRMAAKGQGLNVDTNEVEDLVKAGIIDPTMVTRSALQNAASIAKSIVMTEAIVAEPPEKAGAGMAGGMGGMGDMGGMM